MAIAHRSTGAEGSAANGNITPGAPAGSVANDIWIACIHSSDQVTHSMDAAWTPIVQGNGGGTTSHLSVWWHRYNGTPPSLLVTHTGGQSPIGGIAAFSGCKTSGSPIGAVGTIGTGTDATIEHPGISMTVANGTALLCGGSADDNARTAHAGIECFNEGGDLALTNSSGTPDGSAHMVMVTFTNAGATGDQTVTQSASDPWAGVMVELLGVVLSGAKPVFHRPLRIWGRTV